METQYYYCHKPMTQPKTSFPHTDPPLSPRKTLPTMYDLPSEDPEEPGLPDEFHDLQPELLSRTFRSPLYPSNRVFTGTDMNLYYDVRHPLWHKRPDWFLVLTQVASYLFRAQDRLMANS
ncbi:protein of unknown function DUF820 [Microseira wollei NIES-4236]|uniref:Uma2 family endonuclease n=1 Tax=Microseira wollei NIES-4236 TaxID=2530354 RepID=A0AAV3XBT0_9CYAN|nr:protein of unknown function DUF820 [Microseira wollei NIES-4236]